ncbi:hypothetical protein F2Q69_00025247 [Brassica cretica]|uniref:Uncharacterized protein n=1 Tax=Brassica cretica TaxID=69181 RepID=A0A8S9Q9Z5_BRACR|nr:hypothetical protein F2Q69_00025247 [Brassica cretica]
MGNCFSEDVSSGPGATASVSGTASSSSALATTNDAVDYYLKSRGYNGLFSQIESKCKGSFHWLFWRDFTLAVDLPYIWQWLRFNFADLDKTHSFL